MPSVNVIYLIGFMGCGKTTTGKKLASALGWSFIDLDLEIENYIGKSVPDIFSMMGEEYFRKVESDTLKNLVNKKGIVISTGGGTPCYSDNMEYMLQNGIVIYIKMTPDQLENRLSTSSGVRPLLKNIPREDLRNYIGRTLAGREEWYKKATLVVDGMNLDINKICLEIINLRSE